MKTRRMIILLFIGTIIFACAAGNIGFKEPSSDESMIIIGHVIVEDKGFTDLRKVYKSSIDIAIIGITSDGKEVGFWTETDDQGYFAVSNAPMGEYALKGIRVAVGRGDLITITNRLNSMSDPYLWTYNTEILFNGSYIPFEPVGRIQNLKHTLFSLDFTNQQHPQVRIFLKNRLENIELVSGDVLNEDLVELYFIQKYPDSQWVQALEESAKIDRYPR